MLIVLQGLQMMTYDAIIVGLGAMGSAAAYHLSRRGLRVLGLEAFGRGHTLGSSHGESRIIRMAYMEHPDYVPLLRRTYELWRDLQGTSGMELLRETGGLFIGPPDGPVFAGSLLSSQVHSLPHETLDAAEIRRRHPALHPAPSDQALFEPSAGILFPERCIEAHLQLATASGAELHHDEPMFDWSAGESGVEVRTPEGRYTADKVIFTAGSWLGKLLHDLQLPLQPERIPVYWMQPREAPELFDPARFPIYIWETPDLGLYYGFPHLELAGVKVGRHHSEEPADPDTVDREPNDRDEARVRAFVSRCIPALNGPVASAVVCLYTNTPDENFLVDRHPNLPSVLFAGGFSGHGFKFAPVIGEILADLAMEREATPAANFLRIERFGYVLLLGAAGGFPE